MHRRGLSVYWWRRWILGVLGLLYSLWEGRCGQIRWAAGLIICYIGRPGWGWCAWRVCSLTYLSGLSFRSTSRFNWFNITLWLLQLLGPLSQTSSCSSKIHNTAFFTLLCGTLSWNLLEWSCDLNFMLKGSSCNRCKLGLSLQIIVAGYMRLLGACNSLEGVENHTLYWLHCTMRVQYKWDAWLCRMVSYSLNLNPADSEVAVMVMASVLNIDDWMSL